jgi:hypothetical protein
MSEKGNFIVRINRTKQPGDKRPLFQGHIVNPATGQEYAVALWGSTDKNGNAAFHGRANPYATNAEAVAQIGQLIAADAPAHPPLEDNGMTLDAQQVVLFTNRYKDAEHPNRPDFWGRWNPGNGQPLVAVSAWSHKDRYQRPLIAGQTALPQKAVDVAKDEATPESLDELIEAGTVTKGTVSKTKSRDRSR